MSLKPSLPLFPLSRSYEFSCLYFWVIVVCMRQCYSIQGPVIWKHPKLNIIGTGSASSDSDFIDLLSPCVINNLLWCWLMSAEMPLWCFCLLVYQIAGNGIVLYLVVPRLFQFNGKRSSFYTHPVEKWKIWSSSPFFFALVLFDTSPHYQLDCLRCFLTRLSEAF